MLNIKGERELAYIAKIEWVNPIEGADNIELVGVNGWGCIAKIGEFHVNDLCVYFEIDSKLDPKRPWAAFMETKHYKVKTMKLSKFNVLSQGLALPLSAIPEFEKVGDVWCYKDSKRVIKKNDCCTQLLGVTYSVDEDNIRKSGGDSEVKIKPRFKKFVESPAGRWLMRHKISRKIMFILFGTKNKSKDVFPNKFKYIHKSDEDRCENMPWILKDKQPWVKTTKIDGSSGTYIVERVKHSFKKETFNTWICSRNIVIKTQAQKTFHDSNIYWDMDQKYHIINTLTQLLQNNPSWDYVCIQGEIAGVGVQNNPHKFPDTRFFVFNFIDSQHGRWNSVDAKNFLNKFNIPFVPIVDTNYILPDTMAEMKASADGNCEAPDSKGLREGYVYRSQDGQKSFKNVSNQYLLKKGI